MKKSLLLGLGAVAMAFAAGAGLNKSINEPQPVFADPAPTPLTTTYDFFCDVQDATDFNPEDPHVYCHEYGGGTETTWPGQAMTQISDTLYGVKLKDSNNKKIKFNFGVGKYETAELNVTAGNTYFVNLAEWCSFVDAYVPTSAQTPTASTMRVFINNSDVEGEGKWGSSNADTRIRVTGSTEYGQYTAAIFELTWFENSGEGASSKWYGYADIPTSGTKFQVIRANKSKKRKIWNWGPSVDGIDGTSPVAARTYYMKDRGGEDFDYRYGEWADTTSDSHVGPLMMGKILNAYTTCDLSKLNGVGAYTSLKSNFFDGATPAALSAEIKTLGEGAVTLAASEHIEAMKNRQGGIPTAFVVKSMKSSQIGTAGFVGIVVAVAIVSSVVAVVLTKRRKER